MDDLPVTEEKNPFDCTESVTLTPGNNKRPDVYRRFTFHEVVTPTRKGERAHWTVQEVTVGMRHSSQPFFPVTQACLSRTTVCLSPAVPKDADDSMLKPILDKTSHLATEYSASETSVAKQEQSEWISRKIQPTAKRMKYEDTFQKAYCVSEKSLKKSSISKAKVKGKVSSWKHIVYLHLSLIFVLGGVMYYFAPLRISTHIMDFSHMKLVLNSKVFGQERAVTALLEALEKLSLLRRELLQPVILLSGGTGVGKTFTMSLIGNNFPPPGQSQYVVLPPLPSHDAVLNRFVDSGPHLLVIDNLTTRLAASVFDWIKVLHKKATVHQKFLWVVLIFNVQERDSNITLLDDQAFSDILEDSGKALVSKSKSYGLDTIHIHFSPLLDTSVRDCIVIALRRRGVESAHHINIINEILKVSDYKHQGCKRVWSRVIAQNISTEN